MDSYDVRSEILGRGSKYYLQTNLVPSQQAIVTSLFHEGTLLSKSVDPYEAALSLDDARIRAKDLHEEKKASIQSLLAIERKLKDKDDGKAHLKLSEAFYHQSLYREAVAEVVKAIKLGEETARAFSILGNALIALGDPEKAVKSFQKGLELSPDYPDIHNDLGRAYLQLKRCREAAQSFEKAIELNRYYDEAYLNLAAALCLNVIQKQDYELSKGLSTRLRDIMAKALQLRPSLDSTAFRQAREAAENREYDVAYEKLSTLQETRSRALAAHSSLDLYLILRFNMESISEEEIDRYIERTKRAIDANPNYADLQNELGVLYTAKCKLHIDKARDAFRSAVKINKNFKKAEKNLKLTENDGQGIHLLLRALLD
jgi:Tfp pilus assembly protein PilF